MTSAAYGPEHRRLRRIVLHEEPWCVGYPIGIHDGAPVRTTQLDHKTPLSAGGPTVRGNARGMCAPCNQRKSLDERVRSWRAR